MREDEQESDGSESSDENTMMIPVEMKLTVTMKLMRLAPTVAVAIHLQRRVTLPSVGVPAA